MLAGAKASDEWASRAEAVSLAALLTCLLLSLSDLEYRSYSSENQADRHAL